MKFTYAPGARPVHGYTIRRGLGRGGFGEVYLGLSDGGKEVALKLVQQHLDVELRGVGQCLNLKHPNLVVVHDILKPESGDTWIVMEYVAGESLEQALARHPQGIRERQALDWLHGICAGVRYLHEHGIVHRDLKPGNLFIENGGVKIGDYGLSKFISASRRSGQTVSIGSVHYMAPEISHGRYGQEVDQYALGIILCQMLTGRVPFDGESHGEILMKHLTADPDLGCLTEPYRSVVARLLDKDPRNRYPAVQDLLDELPALDHGVLGPFPGYEGANPPSDAEAGVQGERPAAEQRRSGQAKKRRFAKGPLIRFLGENSMARNDIRRLVRALRKYAGEELAGVTTAVQSMVEHGVDAKDVERVLHAVGACSKQELAAKLSTVQKMIEHGVDARDVERILRALSPCPGQALDGVASVVKHMVENGVDARDVERVLCALRERPEHELADAVVAVQSMVEDGMEPEDIEKSVRARRAYAS